MWYTDGWEGIMTLHEELVLRIKCNELERQGKTEEAGRIRKTLPLPPWLAEWGKKYMGADFLINGNWDLSEAEEAFGSDWLSR
ncbi:hypothetical protein AGMMS49942_15060 [Spirochaetia bacterium]|nr:hypothetical protein AGMMS49942_15060 [Spirochaetia bacterium]